MESVVNFLTHGNVQNISDRDERPAGLLIADRQHIVRFARLEPIVQPLILGNVTFFRRLDHLIIDEMNSVFLQVHMFYLPIR